MRVRPAGRVKCYDRAVVAGTVHVSAYRSRVCDLEVTNCDLKLGRAANPPCAFTEQGVAMLSAVLKSPRAVAVIDAIRQIMTPDIPPKRQRIGFRPQES